MPETFNYDQQTVSILIRKHGGERVTLNYSSAYDCHCAARNDISDHDEILLVAIGDKVVWSQLYNVNRLTLGDLLYFFA